uniref:Uncharacterized protein n=1 Tax=Pithovirus LCDPAC02 TaxID=2506601 RepID=A0A481YPA8_9VIRU|nr:MAG: hypothetical protein LCDPAC02_02900 [Pithovirus LCDPAC02]
MKLQTLKDNCPDFDIIVSLIIQDDKMIGYYFDEIDEKLREEYSKYYEKYYDDKDVLFDVEIFVLWFYYHFKYEGSSVQKSNHIVEFLQIDYCYQFMDIFEEKHFIFLGEIWDFLLPELNMRMMKRINISNLLDNFDPYIFTIKGHCGGHNMFYFLDQTDNIIESTYNYLKWEHYENIIKDTFISNGYPFSNELQTNQ